MDQLDQRVSIGSSTNPPKLLIIYVTYRFVVFNIVFFYIRTESMEAMRMDFIFY